MDEGTASLIHRDHEPDDLDSPSTAEPNRSALDDEEDLRMEQSDIETGASSGVGAISLASIDERRKAGKQDWPRRMVHVSCS